MSGEARTTDPMVDALLAAHHAPALGEDFADRVLAAAQLSPTRPGKALPWPRRHSRGWRRSPLWLSFLALNIVAASAVAAMVSGVPVWHHVTEIVHKVTHIWHREPDHPARSRIKPRGLVARQAPAPAAGPAMIAGAATAPRPTVRLEQGAPKTIVRLRQLPPRPLAINRPGHAHARMMVERRPSGWRVRLRADRLRELHSRQAHGDAYLPAAGRHPRDDMGRASRARTARLPEPQANPVTREPGPSAAPVPEPFGPRLLPQQAFRDRQDRARRPAQALRELRAERRRMRPLDQRMRRSGPRPRRGRFHF